MLRTRRAYVAYERLAGFDPDPSYAAPEGFSSVVRACEELLKQSRRSQGPPVAAPVAPPVAAPAPERPVPPTASEQPAVASGAAAGGGQYGYRATGAPVVHARLG
jgi:hypothetical protein